MAKLVKLLAQELEEWPANALEYITQDSDGHLNTNLPERTPVFNGSGCWTGGSCKYLNHPNFEIYKLTKVAEDFRTAIVTKEMWEAELKKTKEETMEKNCAGLDKESPEELNVLAIRDRIYKINEDLIALQNEREELAKKLQDEGFLLVAKEKLDTSNHMNWKKGYTVEFIGPDCLSFTRGRLYEVESVSSDWVHVALDDEGDRNGWKSDYFRFVDKD